MSELEAESADPQPESQGNEETITKEDSTSPDSESSSDGSAVPKPELQVPSHAIWVHFKFASSGLTRLEFPLQIYNDPGTEVGSYLSFYNATIDDCQFYYGLQTNVKDPTTNEGVGKGLIFSTWWSFDVADLRVVSPGGFFERGTHEGKFIGVRRLYDWTVGSYVVILQRREQDRDGDWFELSIRKEGEEEAFLIGGLRFQRRSIDAPATIRPHGVAFLEVYDGATKFNEISDWHVSMMAVGDGVEAITARSEYPPYPYAEVPCSDSHYDIDNDRIHLAYGGGIVRQHPPSTFFVRGPALALGQAITPPSQIMQIEWTFHSVGLSRLEFPLINHNDPGCRNGSYLSLFTSYIDDCRFYFGLQTDVKDPNTGRGIGKGLIFSTWWNCDVNNVNVVNPGGFFEQGTQDHSFIGVRRLYDWTVGSYVVILQRREQDRDGDWFELSIRKEGEEEAFVIGGLRFQRRSTDAPATIRPHGTSHILIYSRASFVSELADWHVSMMGVGDGVEAITARSEYPAQVTSADAFYDLDSDRVHLSYGFAIQQLHPASSLFSRGSSQ